MSNDIRFPNIATYALGAPFPEELPSGGQEGTCVKLLEGGGMWVLYVLDTPTNMEVNAFRMGKIEWGLLASHIFPWGLMLVRWRKSNGTWMTQELPLSVELEKEARPEAVDTWIKQEANAAHLVMVDKHSKTVVGLRAVGLPALLCQRLAAVWKKQMDEGCDGNTYYRAYNGLCTNYTTDQLWNRAEAYHFVSLPR